LGLGIDIDFSFLKLVKSAYGGIGGNGIGGDEMEHATRIIHVFIELDSEIVLASRNLFYMKV